MTQAPEPRRLPSWFRVLLVAIGLLFIAPIWGGIRMIQAGSVVLGIGLTAVGLITAGLYVRGVRGVVVSNERTDDPAAFLFSDRYVDYAIWTAVGAPLIAAGLLLVWLITRG